MEKIVSNYEKFPVVVVKDVQGEVAEGWSNVCNLLKAGIENIGKDKKVIVMECYPGIIDEEVIPWLSKELQGNFLFSKDCWKEERVIADMVYPDVTDDEVFGYITRLQMKDFFDKDNLAKAQEQIASATEGIFLIYGCGASLLCRDADLLVYFDMPRWEGQIRYRRNEVSNLGVNNKQQKASLQYKQAFFVDWRVADKHKKTLMQKWDYVVDTTRKKDPRIVTGADLNRAYQQIIHQPFRLVPFFDPGPWGGQWMKEYCDLDRNEKNFAWCFDCVPEENSLLFNFNGVVVETPAINLVFSQSRKLLGEAVQSRFGDEFPIRFDFLDTMGGGNLSLQVHPSTEYIREQFGMDYTQDESYYMLDAKPGAFVYLGLKESIRPDKMINSLREANMGNEHFDADRFVEKWPVKKHDHVLIPAGTVHCSGADSMVLEISATPYIFTFKLWDWGRMGLDGRPRPVNVERGSKNINWSRTSSNTAKELMNRIEFLGGGAGWTEERTGLHEREFIETRRHWFSRTVHHHTGGGVNVLNLVEGREVIIESPEGKFEPYIVHYAETFVIPAHVGAYTITPHGESEGQRCATLKAFVRTNP